MRSEDVAPAEGFYWTTSLRCGKMPGSNRRERDNCQAFICSVTGALILSNVELCREMNGGIGPD